MTTATSKTKARKPAFANENAICKFGEEEIVSTRQFVKLCLALKKEPGRLLREIAAEAFDLSKYWRDKKAACETIDDKTEIEDALTRFASYACKRTGESQKKKLCNLSCEDYRICEADAVSTPGNWLDDSLNSAVNIRKIRKVFLKHLGLKENAAFTFSLDTVGEFSKLMQPHYTAYSLLEEERLDLEREMLVGIAEENKKLADDVSRLNKLLLSADTDKLQG